MHEIDWAKAVGVCIFGFGGVFICLALLTGVIQISGLIIKRFVEKKKA